MTWYMLYPCWGQSVLQELLKEQGLLLNLPKSWWWGPHVRGGGEEDALLPSGSTGPDYYMHASYL